LEIDTKSAEALLTNSDWKIRLKGLNHLNRLGGPVDREVMKEHLKCEPDEYVFSLGMALLNRLDELDETYLVSLYESLSSPRIRFVYWLLCYDLHVIVLGVAQEPALRDENWFIRLALLHYNPTLVLGAAREKILAELRREILQFSWPEDTNERPARSYEILFYRSAALRLLDEVTENLISSRPEYRFLGSSG